MAFTTQTSYSGTARVGIPGDLADAGPCDVTSAAAAETGIKAGKFLVYAVTNSDRKQVRLPQVNKITLLQSGDHASGKTYAGTLRATTLAGTNTDTAISEAFDTDHATTADNVLAAFNAISGVTATFTDGATKRSIQLVIAGDKTISSHVDFTLTGLTVTETLSSTDVICGVSGYDPTLEKDTSGAVSYDLNGQVPLIRAGRVFMQAEPAMALSDTVYARFYPDTGTDQERGTCKDAAGSGPVNAIAVAGNVKVYTPSAAANGTPVIELDLVGAA